MRVTDVLLGKSGWSVGYSTVRRGSLVDRGQTRATESSKTSADVMNRRRGLSQARLRMAGSQRRSGMVLRHKSDDQQADREEHQDSDGYEIQPPIGSGRLSVRRKEKPPRRREIVGLHRNLLDAGGLPLRRTLIRRDELTRLTKYDGVARRQVARNCVASGDRIAARLSTAGTLWEQPNAASRV